MAESHRVYLALGTNLGERQKNLEAALQALSSQVKILAVSHLYETAPAYVLDQPAFLNMAVAGQTELAPAELLAYLQQIEKKLGRTRTRRYGPRIIDLDIIFYDDLVLDSPDLTIPHPRLHERGFVLRPLADIAPDFVHPVLKQTVQEMLAALPGEAGVLRRLDIVEHRKKLYKE